MFRIPKTNNVVKLALLVTFVLGTYVHLHSQFNSEKDMKNEKITVEIWSDVVCPFCYVGKKKIEKAIRKLQVEDVVKIEWKSYQLDPNFPADSSVLYYPYLSKRIGYSEDQLKVMGQNLVQSGLRYGIKFNFDSAKVCNTLDLHRLIAWSKQYNLSSNLKEAFMHAYFTDGIDLSVDETVLDIVENAGLSRTEAESVLNSNAYESDVTESINKANQLQVTGVPHFIINGNQRISGAQEDVVFERAIMDAVN